MPSYGYDGPITADQWAKMQMGLGIDYSAGGLAECKVSANASGVQVAPGLISGWGVVDVLTDSSQVNLTKPGSGTTWWMIVARRNWSTLATTFVAISAGSSRPATLPTRNTSPGSLDDQPLALVGWESSQSQPGSIVDLRVVGMAGQQVAYDNQALQYLYIPGRQVRIGTVNWICGINALTGALEWVSGTTGVSVGSNGNGSWLMGSEGLLLCNQTISYPANAGTVQSQNWTYPQAFVTPPHISITPDTTVPQVISTGVSPRSATAATIRMHRTTSSGTTLSLCAMGRWK